jgi:hypothetical protein
MTTINIRVHKDLDGASDGVYPYFVVNKLNSGYFWIVTGPVPNKRNYCYATFLGNADYHPFQYKGEIWMKQYKKIERTRVVLNFR